MSGRALAFVAGGLGLAGLLLLRRRRERPADALLPAPDHAAELRRKLDESRTLVGEREEFEEAETPVDQAQAAGELEARRRRVHDRGRAAADEMKGTSSE